MPRCDHASFRVADLDRSVLFYERVLPARLVSRRQHHDRWRTEIATLVPEGQEEFRLVLLMPRRVRWILRLAHTIVPRQVRSHEHLGFVCASREELVEREAIAGALGAPIANRLTKLDGREGWLLEVHDPDGNAVEWTYGEVEGPDEH
jgi:catechol 2,3-dioxygenase-like lactoylglutathione lyase family enzyme